MCCTGFVLVLSAALFEGFMCVLRALRVSSTAMCGAQEPRMCCTGLILVLSAALFGSFMCVLSPKGPARQCAEPKSRSCAVWAALWVVGFLHACPGNIVIAVYCCSVQSGTLP
jgi:hypothetical protein